MIPALPLAAYLLALEPQPAQTIPQIPTDTAKQVYTLTTLFAKNVFVLLKYKETLSEGQQDFFLQEIFANGKEYLSAFEHFPERFCLPKPPIFKKCEIREKCDLYQGLDDVLKNITTHFPVLESKNADTETPFPSAESKKSYTELTRALEFQRNAQCKPKE